MSFIVAPPRAFQPVSATVQGGHIRLLQVVPLSERLSAAFFDASEDLAVHGNELAGTTGTQALERPLIVTQLGRTAGGLRNVFLLGHSTSALCREGLNISLRNRPLAGIDPLMLQSPVVDPLALLTGLSAEGGRRLLKLLLTTGLSLFGRESYDGFREIVTQLLASLAPPTQPLRAWCITGESTSVASYALPSGVEIASFAELVLLDSGNVRRLAGFDINIETLAGGDRLFHVSLPVVIQPSASLVVLSDNPIRLAGPDGTQLARPLGPWLERRSGPVRRKIRSGLEKSASQDRVAAALLDEIDCPETERPSAVPRLLASTPRGLLYAIGVRDPRNLLRRIVIGRGGEGSGIALGQPLHHPKYGPMQVGYLRCDTSAVAEGATELSLHYRSGRLSHLGSLQSLPFDGALAEILPAPLDKLSASGIADALAEAFADALPTRPSVTATRLEIGVGRKTATCCLVVEVGSSMDYPHALAAALQGDEYGSLLLHHADPAATPLLITLAEQIHAVYGLEVSVAVHSGGQSLPAERLRAVLDCVTAPVSILLSSDALPLGGDWLQRWANRLVDDGTPRIAGGVLLNHDCTIRHAGGEVAVTGVADLIHRDLPFRDLPIFKGGPVVSTLFHASCFGLNAAAREHLRALPLRTPGTDADLSLLAAAVTTDDQRSAVHPELAAIAHAAPEIRPQAVRYAENRILLHGTA